MVKTKIRLIIFFVAKDGEALFSQQKSLNAVLGCNFKNERTISVCFQGKPFTITVIQVYAPTTNVEEDEVEWFYEDLKDFLELTLKKKREKEVFFIIRYWNAKAGSQEKPGTTGKFDLGI